MLRVEKVGAHAAFWEILWAKASPNRASIDSPEKRIMLDYQLTVLLVKVVRPTFSENSEPVWHVHVRIHVAPLACYSFVNIKLAAYYLLLYVVYLCQKSKNFVYALICYKQKCKLVSLNLAHPVDWNSSKIISPLVSNQTCRRTLFIHKTICCLLRNWSFFVFCDFPRLLVVAATRWVMWEMKPSFDDA